MFINFRKIPYEILLYEAFLNRLPINHWVIPEVTSELRKRKAGYRGERDLDYLLSLTPYNKYSIFCDLRLEFSRNQFQIDSLVTSPTFTLLTDVKEWEGTIKYDPEKNQILQIKNDKTIRHIDPVLQAKRQKDQLENWLNKYNCKLAPIEVLVVMSSKNSVLVFDSKNETTEKIVYIDAVLKKLEELDTIYKTKVISNKDINKFAKAFLENKVQKTINVFKTFNVSPKEIVPGVECPCCKKFTMVRKYKTWYCPNCKTHSFDAHVKAITEYLLLHSSITNKECREFLKLTSDSWQLVSRLLRKMNLPYAGGTKNRIYHLPPQ